MALEDLVAVYSQAKELVWQGGFDVSYYLVVFGIALLSVVGAFTLGLVGYRLLNAAVNTDTAGLLKITFILASVLLVVGVLLP
ncbi:hypothetical protein APE_0401a [Aeropyrum pernix K1]|uniref:Uncharacterized protein n=2 Tax=Aeropyrum pernix TaxID=56636 RepID=Q05E74_AERPE|nr:hypothetical protein [Aeropyrum pernix]BAF34727.1 hypothetical protein APE_0401a [Aeropyrum pernix K1]GBF09335.1 hypothetical protein apy_10600 [Aeropyrum pernix]